MRGRGPPCSQERYKSCAQGIVPGQRSGPGRPEGVVNSSLLADATIFRARDEPPASARSPFPIEQLRGLVESVAPTVPAERIAAVDREPGGPGGRQPRPLDWEAGQRIAGAGRRPAPTAARGLGLAFGPGVGSTDPNAGVRQAGVRCLGIGCGDRSGVTSGPAAW
jgi:hypothetical protein